MKQKIIIPQSPEQLKTQMKIAIDESNTFLLKKINERSFHIISKKNYGSLSMIEKEYYKIKGKFHSLHHETELNYEVTGNATYQVMRIVLPLMMLPTIFLSAVGGDKSNLINGLIIYLLLSGITIFWTFYQERKLRKMGGKDFDVLLQRFYS